MARRVNTKFLVIFSVIVLGGVASAFVAQGPIKALIHGNRSKKQIEDADKLVEKANTATALDRKGLLEEASKNYQLAANTETKNPELFVKLGDVFSRLAQFDLGYINQSYAMWMKALEIDPKYTPALHRLMDNYYKQAEASNVAPGIFTQLQDRAQTLHAVDPKDLRAHAILNIAPIRQGLSGIETPAFQIDNAIKELTTLIAQNPTSPETPDMVFHVAMAKVKKALDAKRMSQEREGNILIKEAMTVFADAIKNDPQSFMLHYKFFQMLVYLRDKDAEHDSTQNYTQRLKEELDRARNLVSPADDSFVEIYIWSYQMAKAFIKAPEDQTAEKLMLALYKAMPDDQRVRLQMARMWRSTDKRDLAVELLEKPMQDTSWVGIRAYMKTDLELQSWAELCNLYIERYFSLPVEKRPEELKRIDETYEKLYAKARDRWDVLKLRGRIELLRGGPDANVNAIKTFVKAQERFKIDRPDRGSNVEDADLQWELAKAYLRIREYGSAKIELMKLKDRNPDFLPVRMKLADVLIHEGDLKAARVEVEFMEKQAPRDPDVLKLLLAVLDPVKDAPKIKDTFAAVSEGNREQQLIKAQIAMFPTVTNPDEAVRLYKLVLAKDPADFEALQGVREVLAQQGKKADALALLKAAQAAKPDDKRIDLIIQLLSDVDGDKIKEASEELIRKQYANDPYLLEIKLFEFSRAAGKSKEEAFAHLKAAEKLKPEEVQIMEMMFQYYLGEANWEKAQEYVDRLTAKNADNVGGRIFKFRLAMARADFAAAKKFATELTVEYKDFARSWVFLAQALQSDKKYEDAIGAYNMALERQSDNVEALAGNIVCNFQRAKPTEALRFIERGRAAHPSNPYFKSQWTMYQLSQYGDASKVIKPAMDDRDAKPEDPARWIALGRAQYSAAQKRDNDSAKYVADAKATFAKALEKWPGEMVIWAFLSEIADFSGDIAGGEEILKKMVATKDFEYKAEPALMLADHYIRHNAPEKAEETMKQALVRFKDLKVEKNKPNYANEVRRRLAAFYTQTKRFDDALKLLEPVSADQMIRQQMVEIYMLQAAGDPKRDELYGKAEKLVRSMLTADPENAQLHALLGVVLLNINKKELAIESLNAALKIDPKNQAALYWRGNLRLKSTPPQIDAAVADLTTLRDINPSYVDCRVALAEGLRQQKLATGGTHVEDAARELEFALIRAPYRRDIRLMLAGIYSDMKPTPFWPDVERILTDAEKLEPSELLWKRMLAKLWSTRQKHEDAARKSREALLAGLARERDPAFAPAAPAIQKQIREENGMLLQDYLQILENGKFWQQLESEVQQVFAADKNAVETGWWYYMQRGVARRNLGNPAEAMNDFNRAMQIAEGIKDAGSQGAMGVIIEKLSATMGVQRSIDNVKRLLERAKDAEATRYRIVLARLYYINKDFPNAIDTIEQARSEFANLNNDQKIGALNIAGTVYMISGDYPKARAAFDQLLALKPDDLSSLNNLAFILAEHIKPPEIAKALEHSQKAYEVMIKAGLNDPNVLDTVGWINVMASQAKMGDDKIETGIDYLKKSLAAGEIPEAHYHYGEALMYKKLPEFAKDSFTRASEMITKKENDNNKEPVDPDLKRRVAEAMINVNKALNTTEFKP